MNEVILGDALNVMKNMAEKSVDLVIIDPPYFKVKSEEWDNQWKNSQLFLDWLQEILAEIDRISKPNASLYCFCYPKLSYEVEGIIRKHFVVLNHLIWDKYNDKGFDGWKQKCSKESLRKYYPNSERIIFAGKINSFGMILKKARLEKRISTIKDAEYIALFDKLFAEIQDKLFVLESDDITISMAEYINLHTIMTHEYPSKVVNSIYRALEDADIDYVPSEGKIFLDV